MQKSGFAAMNNAPKRWKNFVTEFVKVLKNEKVEKDWGIIRKKTESLEQ